jgi:aryl-alcohol dehydrogenase-like predicted oxidoreductase
MEFRQLGHSGLQVPVLSFGAGTFGGGNAFFKAWGASDVAEATRLVENEYLHRVVDAIEEVAKETSKSVPQIALNWLLQRPTVANVIMGARNEEQLRQNLDAVGWNLTKDQVAKLDAASATQPIYPYWHQRLQFANRNPVPRVRNARSLF